MIVVENNSVNPSYNHALEEYFFNNYDEDIFIIWRNRPTVLLGRNQNIYKEVNLDYCIENGIDVVRRPSGGGTIYCDLDIIQYSFITKEREGDSFRYFTKPIINTLAKFGIDGEFTGRNDLVIEGKKFSGNAQYHNKGKVLHHGSILFGGNVEVMKHALRPNPLKFVGKNVSSISSRVGCLKELLDMSVTEFMDEISRTVMEDFEITKFIKIDREIDREIRKIVDNKYGCDDWNYGKNPKANIKYSVKHDFGIVEYAIGIEEGIIKEMKMYGDFFGMEDVKSLTDKLQGIKFSEKHLRDALKDKDISCYITGLSIETLIKDLFYKDLIDKELVANE